MFWSNSVQCSSVQQRQNSLHCRKPSGGGVCVYVQIKGR